MTVVNELILLVQHIHGFVHLSCRSYTRHRTFTGMTSQASEPTFSGGSYSFPLGYMTRQPSLCFTVLVYISVLYGVHR